MDLVIFLLTVASTSIFLAILLLSFLSEKYPDQMVSVYVNRELLEIAVN